MIDLEALKAAAEAATPGPWTVRKLFAYEVQDDIGRIITCHSAVTGDQDAAFIALANPETVKQLVAVVEAGIAHDEWANANIPPGAGDDLPTWRAFKTALAPFRGES